LAQVDNTAAFLLLNLLPCQASFGIANDGG